MLHNSTYAGKLKDSGDLIGIYVDKMQKKKQFVWSVVQSLCQRYSSYQLIPSSFFFLVGNTVNTKSQFDRGCFAEPFKKFL